MRLGALSDEMLRKAAPSLPISVSGQYELFPEPDTDRFSVSALVMCYTEQLIRVTKLSSHLSRQKRERLITEYYATLVLVETYERDLADFRLAQAEAWHARIA